LVVFIKYVNGRSETFASKKVTQIDNISGENMKLKYPALVVALYMSSLQANDLVITGVIDGPLSGGTP
jgi:hypothetical protein